MAEYRLTITKDDVKSTHTDKFKNEPAEGYGYGQMYAKDFGLNAGATPIIEIEYMGAKGKISNKDNKQTKRSSNET